MFFSGRRCFQPQSTTGGVNPLHRHYTGLTHTYCVGLVEKQNQRGLIHYIRTNCDTYPLTVVKMKFLFLTCEKIVIYCAMFFDTYLTLGKIRIAISKMGHPCETVGLKYDQT